MLSIVMALGIGLLAVAVLHHSRPAQRVSTSPTERVVIRRILGGQGIGNVRFGQSPTAVAIGLGRLFGAPVGADQISHGYRHAACGFDWEVWDGLGTTPDGHFFVAQLIAYFNNARFVGYAYDPNNFQTRMGNWAQYAGHPLALATTAGLGIADAIADGERIYRARFSVIPREQGTPPNPSLTRLPTWKASTATGRTDGAIGDVWLVESTRGRSRSTARARSVAGINAGMIPNTPCHNSNQYTATFQLPRGHTTHVLYLNAPANLSYQLTVSTAAAARLSISTRVTGGTTLFLPSISPRTGGCTRLAAHLRCLLHFAAGGNPGGHWALTLTKDTTPAVSVSVAIAFNRE